MKQEPLKRRRPAARKRGRKQTFRAVVLSVLTVSVIALCLWTKDRVLAHNPVGALYQTKAYYKKLMADPASGEKEQ